METNKIELTREELSILIHSVQRAIIKLEQFKDNSSELVRKHRCLIKTLLSMEKQLINNIYSKKTYETRFKKNDSRAEK
jgi:hypothetical protein